MVGARLRGLCPYKRRHVWGLLPRLMPSLICNWGALSSARALQEVWLQVSGEEHRIGLGFAGTLWVVWQLVRNDRHRIRLALDVNM